MLTRAKNRPAATPHGGDDARIAPLRTLHPPRAARPSRSRPVGGAIKRAFDLAGASAALVLVAPLLLGIACAVRLESRGPVFFLQRRGGLGRRTFLIYKFRTMTVLDDGKDLTQAAAQDPRLTRIGAFLRRTSLDELPQFWNVVRGEMSLVGPRPHAVAHDARFAALVPEYKQRRRARPGISGLAQISGSRGPTDTIEAIRTRVRHDLDYIERWSPALDAQIILKTIWMAFRDRSAF